MPSLSSCSFTLSFLVGGGRRGPHSSAFEVSLSLFPSDSEAFSFRYSRSGQGLGLLRKARNRVAARNQISPPPRWLSSVWYLMKRTWFVHTAQNWRCCYRNTLLSGLGVCKSFPSLLLRALKVYFSSVASFSDFKDFFSEGFYQQWCPLFMDLESWASPGSPASFCLHWQEINVYLLCKLGIVTDKGLFMQGMRMSSQKEEE